VISFATKFTLKLETEYLGGHELEFGEFWFESAYGNSIS